MLQRTILRGSQGFSSDISRQLNLVRTRAVAEASYDNRFVDEWTRLGGENFASAPHRESALIGSDGPFLHFEVGGQETIPPARLEQHAAALRLLLHDAESAVEMPLTGPVAEWVRRNPELREEFLREAPDRGTWAQTESGGELRQLVMFQNHRPLRILLGRRAMMPTGKGPQSYAEEPLVYDLQFNPEGSALQSVALYAQRDGRMVRIQSLDRGNSLFQASANGLEYQLYSQKGSSTPAALNLRLIPAGNHRGLEIRDRVGNILLSLSPERVMESPAQRLLSLFEFSEDQVPAHVRQRSETQIRELLGQMSATPRGNGAREEFLTALGRSPVSMVRRLLRLADESRDPAERRLIDEIIARREITGFWHRHRFESYEAVDENTSLVRFNETGADGTSFPRLMLRIHSETGLEPGDLVDKALGHLTQAQGEVLEARDHVIQIVSRHFDPAHIERFQSALNVAAQARAIIGSPEGTRELGVKRLTLVVDRPGEYPDYFTFRRAENAMGQREGRYEEDTRYRSVHPMLAHLIELRRLDQFSLERDLTNSSRTTHIYFARNKAAPGVDAGADQRIFGLGLVPEATIERNATGELQEIPKVEEGFVDVIGAMHRSIESLEGRRPYWNRMFLNIQPILAVTDAEVAGYAERLAIRHRDQLRGLGLEKVVVKGRIRDPREPEGYRTILVRVTNPTSFRYEPMIHNVVRARVQAADGSISQREVLLRNGTYENWRAARDTGRTDYAIPNGEWAPADIPIRPATPAEIREQQARARGAVWAYRIPELIEQEAETFRVQNGLGTARLPGSERPEASASPNFVELDLDPASTVMDSRTGLIDYNQGRLIPAVDAEGLPRPAGQNQAGVVIGIQSDNVGIPIRRVVIMGDLTHASRGSLSANECARINAAIRYAAEQGLPVDWFTASSGAEIHEKRGVEGLDATASTVREIV
ncbi:MAG: hypothetical protein K8R69_11995, partial [Deltaproteobacteria bacterium]|nr:hypothetical protein [Deltaproteobacteria bacterium]